jgi:hypothetical protein
VPGGLLIRGKMLRFWQMQVVQGVNSRLPRLPTSRPRELIVNRLLLGDHLAALRRERARIQSVQKLGRCNGLFRITVEPPMDWLMVN